MHEHRHMYRHHPIDLAMLDLVVSGGNKQVIQLNCTSFTAYVDVYRVMTCVRTLSPPPPLYAESTGEMWI